MLVRRPLESAVVRLAHALAFPRKMTGEFVSGPPTTRTRAVTSRAGCFTRLLGDALMTEYRVISIWRSSTLLEGQPSAFPFPPCRLFGH